MEHWWDAAERFAGIWETLHDRSGRGPDHQVDAEHLWQLKAALADLHWSPHLDQNSKLNQSIIHVMMIRPFSTRSHH
jgi:hypothetical protein